MDVVRAVWTDFGGVLTPPVTETMTAYCTRMALDPTAVGAAIWKVTQTFGTTDVMEPLDTPLVSERDWLRLVTDAMFEAEGTRVELTSLGEVWFQEREPNHEWIAALRRLRERGVFVGMLSNMPPAWDEHWRRMVPPEGLFDEVLLSFEMGHRKPAREVFEIAAAEARVPARQCLFVDDLAKNCEGARAAGWQAIHFTDTATAIAELGRLVPAAGAVLVGSPASSDRNHDREGDQR